MNQKTQEASRSIEKKNPGEKYLSIYTPNVIIPFFIFRYM